MIDVNRIIRIVQVKLFAIALMICIATNSTAQDQFTHIASRANRSCNGDCTQLDVPDLNGNPNAIIYVTPATENEPHLIGLFYFKNRWNIMNLDQKVLPPGSRFNVSYVTKADPNHFLYSFKLKDIQKDGTAFIDHPALNDRPNIQVNYFVCWMPEINNGIPNRDEVQLQFNREAGRWHLTNVNKKPLYQQLAYNIIISNDDKINSVGIIIPETDKLIIKMNEAGIIIPDVGTPVLRKNEAGIIIPDFGKVIPKKVTPSYDFSKVKICIDQVFNNNLPPRNTQYAIPKINSNGVIQPVTSVTQGLSGLTEFMWSAGEKITVAFNPGSPAGFITKVKQYVKEWETYANITFEFITSVSAANIKIDFTQDNSSWSWIGRDVLVNPNNYVTMNFGWFTTTTPDTEFRRTILHEFGHALGFVHEHQAAGAGIPWDKDKVYKYLTGDPYFWDTTKINNNVFTTYSKTTTNSSTYDRLSIMHYSFPSDLTTDGSSFTWNTNLSTVDKSFAKQVYPFPPASTGILRTGDDCDEIEFSIEYGAVAKDQIEFVLLPGLDHNNLMVNWWKMIGIPVKDLPAINGLFLYTTKKIPVTWIDRTKPITFGKAKILGVHTGLPFTWNVWPAIVGGCRVKFIWRRDSCN